MADAITFLTPVGRLVQGSPFKPNTTDMYGNQLVYKTGAQAGQPRSDYYMALAIPKTEPSLQGFIDKIQQAAMSGFPGGQYNAPGFSWKIIDGDGMDRNGQPYANREGFAGHYVFKFSGSMPPQCVTAGGASLLTDPDSIKRGYYIRIYGNTSANGNMQNPGVYLNHSKVELIGYGPEIVSGPDAAEIFGSQPAQLPAGASATPLAPTTPLTHPGVPGAVPPPQAAPGYPGAAPGAPAAVPPPQAAPGYPGAAPGTPGYAPHPGFNNPQQ